MNAFFTRIRVDVTFIAQYLWNGSMTGDGAEMTNAPRDDDTVSSDLLAEDVMMTQTWLRVVFVALYVAVFIVGLSGNSLVVFVVARNRAMHTITNVFIANLAISDIMMCLLAVPFTPAAVLLKSWPFGEVMCHVVPMTLGVSVHVSTLTSIAIAVDRYCVIVHPFQPRMTRRVCLLIIAAVWITSMFISTPLAIYQKMSPYAALDDDTLLYMCHEQWPQRSARQFFTVTSLVLQYVVPCVVITYCYSCVSITLDRRARTKASITGRAASRCHGDREQIEIRRKRRTNRMLIAMVTIFVFCWLPLNVLHVAQESNDQVIRWHYFLLTFLMTHVTAMSSTIYNPFLYAWMNDNFRKEFKQVLPRWLWSSCISRTRNTETGRAVVALNGGDVVIAAGASLYTTVDVTAGVTTAAVNEKRHLTAVTSAQSISELSDQQADIIVLDQLRGLVA